jgi:hypothetical protein
MPPCLRYRRWKCSVLVLKSLAILAVVMVPAVYVVLDASISGFGHLSSSRLDHKSWLQTTSASGNWQVGATFPSKPLVLLSIDYHQSPVEDLIDLLGPLGVQFMQKGVMTYGCHFFNSCRTTGSWLSDWVSSSHFLAGICVEKRFSEAFDC